MKAHDAVIAWTPMFWSDNPTVGKVTVRNVSGRRIGWLDDYQSAIGAIGVDWRQLRGDALKHAVFIEFVTLVVRDGLDPQVVHKAFLAIDEYAETISPDTPGARFPDD